MSEDMQNRHNSFRPNKNFCLSDCVAFIYVTFYFLSASKSLTLQHFSIIKTMTLLTFQNPELPNTHLTH